ncbi:hypothetical protein [Pseudomarimonas salicorniae]|uniref:Lipoprotein n=1 Tax=Pseudomarimonas salicorniae TaxID=2933270 RepID=A0ABT0GCW7_9GAMM|nr:hypothetical protein [Lysobacter sp. CAU 1642]MCK7592375.1 hypothetical protein [Lysobacter sp. CAU 1642]
MTLRIALFLLLGLLATPFSAMAAAELVDPDPLAVPAGVDGETVATEIKRALIGRGWVVTGEQPGRIDASLHLRAHVARVAISFDTESVRVNYVSSDNLDYREKKGRRYIHKNYLSWVNNVLTDLSRNLQMATL